MRDILVIRLSSMGDVALTVPVLKALISQNDNLRISVLTKKDFNPLFKELPIQIINPDLKGNHKGLTGLYRLSKELRKIASWEAVFDLHDVLRSKVLRLLLKRIGIKVFSIDKGRTEKKALTRKNNKEFKPLTSTLERYAKTFKDYGLTLNLDQAKPLTNIFKLSDNARQLLGNHRGRKVGIAPFAKHRQKMYPLEKMENIIRESAGNGIEVYLFGGGEEEKKPSERIVAENDNVTSVVGKFPLEEELALMEQMDVMLSMDSANMHLAALVGTKVISIWGGTHNNAGFGPFLQSDEDQMIQVSVEELPCRPCSVFGNKPCYRGDWACMHLIEEETVLSKLRNHLSIPC